jgi:hypothetical protein
MWHKIVLRYSPMPGPRPSDRPHSPPVGKRSAMLHASTRLFSRLFKQIMWLRRLLGSLRDQLPRALGRPDVNAGSSLSRRKVAFPRSSQGRMQCGPLLSSVKFEESLPVVSPVVSGGAALGWAAHTTFWTLETGTPICLVGSPLSSHPPRGTDLPILLADGAVVKSRVVSASRSKIVIDLDGCRRLLTRAPRSIDRKRRLFGSEWILGKPFVGPV